MIHLAFNITDPITLNGKIQTLPGKITLISGPTGSGKTTLLYRLIGIQQKGIIEYTIDGKKVNEVDLKNKVSLVYQNPLFLEDLSLKDLLELLPEYTADSIIEMNQLIKEMHIDCSLNSKIKNLSGGEKQRISIILALLRNPRLLVLDEPTSSLDSTNKIIMMDVLKREIEKRQIAVIMTSHDQVIYQYCNYQGRIEDHHLDISVERQLDSSSNELKRRQHHSIYRYWIKKIKMKKRSMMIKECLLILLFSVLFGLHHYFYHSMDDIGKSLNVSYIYSNANLLEDDRLISQIRSIDGIEKISYSNLKLNNQVTINNQEYDFGVGIQSYYPDGKVDFIKKSNKEGVYINQKYALQFHLDINDEIIIEHQSYRIAGIMNEYHPSYCLYDGMVLYYPNWNINEVSNKIFIKIENGLESESIIQQILAIDESGNLSYLDYTMKRDLDYYSDIITIEKVMNYLVIGIIGVLLALVSVRNEKKQYKDYIYLLSTGITRNKLCLSLIINKLLIFWIVLIYLLVEHDPIYRRLLMIIVVSQIIISILPLYSNKRRIEFLRSRE